MTLRGRIIDAAPVIYGHVRQGRLYLGPRGDAAFVIDTGFTGSVAVPSTLARRINSTFVAIDTYTLATGLRIELPMYIGSMQIGAHRLEGFVIGDALVGMEFLEQVCSHVHVDFEARSVELVLK